MEGYKPQDFSFFHRSEKLVQLIIEKFRNYYKDFHKIGFSTKKEKLIIELFNISPTIIKLCYKY